MSDDSGIIDHSRSPKEVFTEEALKSQDGKTVPVTLEFGGPVVGEATLKYDPEEKGLTAEFRVDDPDVREFLKGPMPREKFIGEAE